MTATGTVTLLSLSSHKNGNGGSPPEHGRFLVLVVRFQATTGVFDYSEFGFGARVHEQAYGLSNMVNDWGTQPLDAGNGTLPGR